MIKRFFILIFLFTIIFTVSGQSGVQTVEEIINDIFEQYSAENEESLDYESFYNDLMSLVEYPLDLNNATQNEFEKLAFLSDVQIDNILFYIYQNGGLNTIYELQLIEGLDMTDIRRMLPFVKLGDKKLNTDKIYWREILKYGKSNLYLRIDKGLESPKGYLSTMDNMGNSSTPYLGSSFYNSVRYNYNFRDRIRFGLSMEKDPGELFDFNKTKGFDFYSFHFQASNLGKINNLVLGDYRASFGQGLVFGSGFGAAKSSYVTNITLRNNGFKNHGSTDEINFFRGVGATLKLKNTELNCFYSNKMIDADTVDNTFKTIYKTGLHNTKSELENKHTVNQQVVGFHAELSAKLIRLGVTLATTIFNSELIPDTIPYNLYYFRGKVQTVAGFDYRARLGKFNVFGEAAVSGHNGFGTLNGLQFSPQSTVNLVALWRFYSPAYDTFYANAFSEGTRTNNETGMYLGTELKTFRNLRIAFYLDSYRFIWLKYGVNAPSVGQDYLLQIDYVPKRNFYMNWRFRYETKERNNADKLIPYPQKYTKSSARYQLTLSSGNFSTKNLIELNYSDSVSLHKQIGFAAYQDLSYSFTKIPLNVDLRYMVFDSPDYDNRFYLYEKDVLNAFSIPMFNGIGTRFYINLRYSIAKNLNLWLKYSQTIFSDGRRTNGSGYEEIAGNKKSDIRILINYVF